MYYLGKRLGLMAIILAAAFCFSAVNAEAQQEITAGMLGENILDMDVRTQNGEEVGEIEDVIFSQEGRIEKFILDIGEFLGLGGKRVSVSRKELKYDEQGGFAVYQGTERDLEAMPEIEYYSYRYGYHPGRTSYRPYYDPYRTPGYSDSYYYGAAYRDPYVPSRNYGYYDPYTPDRYRYEEGEMRRRGMARQERRGEQGRYMEQGRREDRRMARQDQRRMDRNRYSEQTRQGETGRGYYQSPMQRNEIPMERLIESLVRTRDGETAGEIENLIVDRRGRITHAVMEVGGFLDIGDKKVAVSFDKLESMGPYYVMYKGTEEELENMPEFDPDRVLGEGRGWLRPQKSTTE